MQGGRHPARKGDSSSYSASPSAEKVYFEFFWTCDYYPRRSGHPALRLSPMLTTACGFAQPCSLFRTCSSSSILEDENSLQVCTRPWWIGQVRCPPTDFHPPPFIEAREATAKDYAKLGLSVCRARTVYLCFVLVPRLPQWPVECSAHQFRGLGAMREG